MVVVVGVDASAVLNPAGRVKDDEVEREEFELEELPPLPPLPLPPVEDFIIASQAEEDVQVRQGLPSLSRTTPFGNVFGGWLVVLGLSVAGFAPSFPRDRFVNACGKRLGGIACVAGRAG